MPPQSLGNLIAAFGAAALDGTAHALCAAFVSAVAAWCANDPKTKGHDFNNVFFEKLADQNPKLAESITREAPMLVTKGTADPIGMLVDLQKGVGCSVIEMNMARGILDALTLLTGTAAAVAGWARSFRMQGINALAREGGKSAYGIKYPDGMMKDGQLLEVKGPKDTFGKQQYEAYDNQSRAKTGKPPLVVSCGSCGADCDNGTPCKRG